MTFSSRLTTSVLFACTFATAFVLAQAPAPQPQAPASQPQTPAPEAGGRGRQNAPAGARRGGFAQFMRPLATQDVLVRGKALYDANCASCHAPDLRGTLNAGGTNLLRSGLALRDQKGELIAPAIRGHKPPINLVDADGFAIAEYIHSVHATMGGAGSPPGRSPSGEGLNVLVGDAKAGEAQFATLCSKCHSATGNLRGIASKFPDARALQNGWVAGSTSTFAGGGGGGGREGGAGGSPVTVTMADGSKISGTLIRRNDFIVVLTLPDGTRRSIARNDGVPRVDVTDPQAAHKEMALKLAFDDPDNRKMYDITAYLWTLK